MKKYNLTFPQKNIYMVDMLNKDTALNTIAGTLKIDKNFDIQICIDTIKEVIKANDALRINIASDSNPYQIINEYEDKKIEVIDLSDKSKEQIDKFLQKMTEEPIDINSNCLAKFYAVITGKNSGAIYLKLHHIVGDAWTLMQIVNQLSYIYTKKINNEVINIENPSYTEFILSEGEYIKSDKFAKDEEFWKEYLKDISSPVSLKEKSVKLTTNAKRYSVTLSKEENDKIVNFAKENRFSVYTMLLSALATYVYRVKDVDDIVIGTPILNRSNFKEKKMLGCFISTIPMRIKITENMKFIDLIKMTSSQTLTVFRHQKYPITNTIENVHNESDVKGKIYNLMLSYQNARADLNGKDGMSTEWIFSGHIQDELEIHVMDMDNTGVLTINYDYLSCLFDDVEIEYLHTRLMAIIQDLISNPEVSVEDIRIMSKEEESKILYEFNDTFMSYPKDKTVIELFEEQVKKTPDNIALVFEDKKITYKELNEKANMLAHYLKDKKNIKENDKVIILMGRSEKVVISILACQKLGATYIPIDATYPKERIKFIIKNSESNLILVDNKYDDIDESLNVSEIDYFNKGNLKLSIHSDSFAYIIYTSGSTGTPKGVMISNSNLMNFIFSMNKIINLSSNNSVVSVTTISFDIFGLELWLTLLNGAKMVLANFNQQIDSQSLNELCMQNEVDVIQTTPTKLSLLTNDEFNLEYIKNMKKILLGGEKVQQIIVDKLFENTDAEIYDVYGPTETTIWSTAKRLSKGEPVNCGRPIGNTKLYILDKKNRNLPLFCVGQLGISGESVSKGYFNDEVKTKNSFVKINEQVVYLTGDLARYDIKYNLDIVGRNDFQIKLNGQRIELEEIENVILSNKDINNAVVCLKNSSLVCYYSGNEINKYSEQERLSASLPRYMVPNIFIKLDYFPMTTSGKIDRKKVNLFELDVVIDDDIVMPSNEIEQIIYDCWQKVFVDKKFGVTTDFFELGGDSLDAIKIKSYMENNGICVEYFDLMMYPTIKGIAKNVKVKNVNTNVYDMQKKSILSSQSGIFMKYLLDTESTLYNIPFEVEFDANKVDSLRLKYSIERTLNKHTNVFSSFDIVDGNIIQNAGEDLHYDVEISEVTYEEYKSIKQNFVKPFDLLLAPLFNIKMYIVENKIHVLFDFHHIIFDGMSIVVLVNNIVKAYNEENIENERITYKEYISNKVIKESDIDYFKEMFKDEVSINDLPYDRNRVKNLEFRGNKLYANIDKDTFEDILKYVKENKITLNSFMQSTFIILMAKYTYNEDIIFGMVDSGRTNVEILNSIGMFTRTIPYRQNVNWNENISSFMKYTQNRIYETISHDSVTYEDIIKVIDIPKYPNRNPLFDVLFVFQNIGYSEIYVENEKVEIKEIKRNNSKFDVTFEIIPTTDNIDITVEYKTALFNESTIVGMIENYKNILKYIINNPYSKLKDIDMISEEEKNKIINDFNDTKTNYPKEMAIHQVFENSVIKYPYKTAIVFKDIVLTYDELNKKANKLARLLLNKNLKSGDVVGVMIDKSSEYMIALLGILKAGLVYMPISEDMPDERVKYVVEDAAAKCIITTKKFDRKNIKFEKIIIDVDDKLSDYYSVQDDTNLNVNVKSTDKAYVLYTSGTTGTPKGITIIHKGIIRLLLNTNLVDYSSNDVMLVSGSVTFDTSGFEIWGAMFYGMTLHFIEKKNILNPAFYEKYLIDNNITTTLIPTPIFNQLTEYNPQMFEHLSTLYVGGDVLLSNYSNEIIEKCPNTKLINIYGPTENTVITSFDYINNKTQYDVSIGKPISNTTCYIVDKCSKLCPIKVPGELYTGGDGLGIGYINKPDITKEKFIHYDLVNADVYKTGDLASFNVDGKIKFMGRIDTQIKLRGQRIEILEIQNKILELEHIKECVVLLKEKSNMKFLVAYYTCDSNISESEIKKYISQYLPNYMIPYKFIMLDKMPLNQNSKIDRKMLPDFEFDRADIVKPKNDKQKRILEIYKEVLSIDQMSMEDNFFDLGGDSLSAMKLVGTMEESNFHIIYSDVFEYPTPMDIYNKIENNVTSTTQNFEKYVLDYDYSKFDKILNIENDIQMTELKGILLIGATGFLGAHILDQFATKYPNLKIYCLVREKHGVNSKDRFYKTLNYYFESKYDDNSNIHVVEGDITTPGIIKQNIDFVNDIDLVINSAAHVKHFGNENVFEEINIKGVDNILDFCISNNKKLIHISTLSVSGNLLEGGQISQSHIKPNTIFDETSFYIGQNLNNIYALSKFIAEKNILEKIEQGLVNATIIRVGNLTGRYLDGKFQINANENAFLNRIKTFLNLGFVPENILDLDVEFSPVDLTAEAIACISSLNKFNTIYHVYNINHIKLSEIVNIFNSIGYNIKSIPTQESTKIIRDMIKNEIKYNMVSGIIQDLNEEKELKYESNIKISCKKTCEFLRHLGFAWPNVENDYVLKFLYSCNVIQELKKGGNE